jgi:hypothetical protein
LSRARREGRERELRTLHGDLVAIALSYFFAGAASATPSAST